MEKKIKNKSILSIIVIGCTDMVVFLCLFRRGGNWSVEHVSHVPGKSYTIWQLASGIIDICWNTNFQTI